MIEVTRMRQLCVRGPRDLAHLRTSIRATANALSRWRPEADAPQRTIVTLALTLLDYSRQLLERQALRRLDEATLSDSEAESIGIALARLEQIVRDLT